MFVAFTIRLKSDQQLIRPICERHPRPREAWGHSLPALHPSGARTRRDAAQAV